MQFLIRDGVTNVTSNFTDNFQLRVVGGGPNLPITLYSPSKIQFINPNATMPNLGLIWGPCIVFQFSTKFVALSDGGLLQGTPILNSSLTIKWICLSGSPCSSVAPSTSTAPHYYFLFELNSQNTDLKVTYCTRKIQFLVKITGIPPTFLFSTIVSTGTFATLLAMLLFLMFYLRYNFFSNV